MRKPISVFGVLALGLLTASCGSTETQRAATGGVTGIAVGAVVGGPIGAAVGGVVGAAGGSALPEGADNMAAQALNIEHRQTRSALNSAGLTPGATAAAPGATTAASGTSVPSGQMVSADEAKHAQRVLKSQGLYHGRIDGIVGPQTKHALSSFQQREGLPQTAALDPPTLDKLKSMRAASAGSNNPAAGNTAAAQNAESPSAVRQRLSEAGYTDVSDLHRQADNTWSANAQRNGETMAVRVDAKTGRVIEEHAAASPPANSAPSSGTSQPNGGTPPAANNSPANPPSNETAPSPSNAPNASGSAPQTPNH